MTSVGTQQDTILRTLFFFFWFYPFPQQDNDASTFDQDSLSSRSVISRLWQVHIEWRTFQWLEMDTARLKTAVASETLFHVGAANPTVADIARRRLAALRYVKVTVTLPLFDKAVWLRSETDAERTANNAAFTEAVHDLFCLLARSNPTFDTDIDTAPRIHLYLAAYCQSDRTYFYESAFNMRAPGFVLGDRGRRFESSYTDFCQYDSAPRSALRPVATHRPAPRRTQYNPRGGCGHCRPLASIDRRLLVLRR